MRIKVTEIKTAAQGGTNLSRNTGRAYTRNANYFQIEKRNEKIRKTSIDFALCTKYLHGHRVAEQKSTQQQMLILHHWKYFGCAQKTKIYARPLHEQSQFLGFQTQGSSLKFRSVATWYTLLACSCQHILCSLQLVLLMLIERLVFLPNYIRFSIIYTNYTTSKFYIKIIGS